MQTTQRSHVPAGSECLFVFGLGYSARAVVARMKPRLDAIAGTTRDVAKLDGIAALGATPILFDARALSPLAGERRRGGTDDARGGGLLPSLLLPQEAGNALEYVLVSIAPDAEGDPVLRHFAGALAAARPKSVVYLSTVGVYGDHGGAWVDETTECRPVSVRSRQRVAAEAAWRAFAKDTGIPVAILRLAGIYGSGRGPFEKIRRGTARRIIKQGQIFNRIHVADIAQIVEAAFDRRADGTFNGSDDEPAAPEIVLDYAAKLLGLPPPPEIAFEDAELSPMARSFYGESKRVRNNAIKRELGVRLAYPTYREGLAAILAAEAAGT